MFTGIVTAIGRIHSIEADGIDSSMVIEPGNLDLSDVVSGDSISINGVCLTVTGMNSNGFQVDISAETLACTALGGADRGDRVNLEKAMQAGGRLGGHLVTGHVDGVGMATGLMAEARSMRFDIEVPDKLACYLCRKGSVCVDGVSLTINEITGNNFTINIIPHTMQNTIFADYRQGSRVNIEVDIIARYLERLMEFKSLDGG